MGISGDTLRNYASLTELLPQLLKLVDEKQIALSPAYQLAYLTKDEQMLVLDALDYSQNMPSLSQAQRLKKASQQGALTVELSRSIMSEEKKSEQDRVVLTGDKLKKYFPKSYTPQKMEETIIKLLEAWQKKRQRSQER